jgi:hypothetical protein
MGGSASRHVTHQAAGRLGGWAAGRLGGSAAGRLGGWAAGRRAFGRLQRVEEECVVDGSALPRDHFDHLRGHHSAHDGAHRRKLRVCVPSHLLQPNGRHCSSRERRDPLRGRPLGPRPCHPNPLCAGPTRGGAVHQGDEARTQPRLGPLRLAQLLLPPLLEPGQPRLERAGGLAGGPVQVLLPGAGPWGGAGLWLWSRLAPDTQDAGGAGGGGRGGGAGGARGGGAAACRSQRSWSAQ